MGIMILITLVLTACDTSSPRANGLLACLTDPKSIAVDASGTGWIVGTGFVGGGNEFETRQHCTDALHLSQGSWTQVAMPPDSSFSTVAEVSPTDVWAGAGDKVFQYDGTQWTSTTLPFLDTLDSGIFSISMDSATDGWAVVASSTYPLMHYTDGSWQEGSELDLGSGIDQFLTKIVMLSPTDGWAVGTHFIAHYDGTQWTLVNNDITQRTDISLQDIAFDTSDDGWAVGEIVDTSRTPTGGIILHYANGAWTVAGTCTSWLMSIAMVSPTDGWIGGTAIFHLENGQWMSAGLPSEDDMVAIAMLSSTEGWAISGNAIYRYLNGTWTAWHVRGPNEP